jgi:hypothetical protein
METKLTSICSKTGKICFVLEPKFELESFRIYDQLIEHFQELNICLSLNGIEFSIQRLINSGNMNKKDLLILKQDLIRQRYFLPEKLYKGIENFLRFEPKKETIGFIKKKRQSS